MIEPIIYKFTDTEREVHMVGDYVGVCWNLKVKPFLPVENGERDRKPCIDFVWVRDESTDEPYKDEDSPVDGGIDALAAEQIAKELLLAVKYMRGLEGQQ